jgi:hypothetical protein
MVKKWFFFVGVVGGMHGMRMVPGGGGLIALVGGFFVCILWDASSSPCARCSVLIVGILAFFSLFREQSM